MHISASFSSYLVVPFTCLWSVCTMCITPPDFQCSTSPQPQSRQCQAEWRWKIFVETCPENVPFGNFPSSFRSIGGLKFVLGRVMLVPQGWDGVSVNEENTSSNSFFRGMI